MANMAKTSSIPVVDCQNDIASAADKIVTAFQTIGFVYLKNFGISNQQVSDVFQSADDFWALPMKIKKQYAKPKEYAREGFTGFVAPDVEILDDENSHELRESFDVALFDQLAKKMPPKEVLPDFENQMTSFYLQLHKVALEILRAIASALGFEDPDFFSKIHRLESGGENMTSLRLLHYPPIAPDADPDTGRLGEHTDYGTITLLFQDDVGGLEVLDKNGNFVPAHPLPNAVLVNAGDLLQRWTNDRIKAVKHRVLRPKNKQMWGRERRSVVMFVHPDSAFQIEPISGEEGPKYAPTTSKDHLLQMFGQTFY